MKKFTMELVWHNCATCPPSEEHNDYLVITKGDKVYPVIYDKTDGWFYGRLEIRIQEENLKHWWWADIVQTVQGTPQFGGVNRE